MSEVTGYLHFTTEPPQPDRVEFVKPLGERLFESSDETHTAFGYEVGLELIDKLTLPEHRTADSVDVATAALVLFSQSNLREPRLKPQPFMHGVVQAMQEQNVWRTRQGKQSLLAS